MRTLISMMEVLQSPFASLALLSMLSKRLRMPQAYFLLVESGVTTASIPLFWYALSIRRALRYALRILFTWL
jgi:hypothetical protein